MTMIERVARAIDAKQIEGHGAYVLARAAIEAMRVPTEAMLDAAYWLVAPDQDSHPIPSDAYTAMIDAALEETK